MHKNLHGDLRNVSNVAQNSQNQNVRVQVLRNGQVKKQFYYIEDYNKSIVSALLYHIQHKEIIHHISGYDIGSETSSVGGSWINWVSHCAN